ncbi:MAG: peptidylprolyl isomerase [Pseudomonadota bacterium]
MIKRTLLKASAAFLLATAPFGAMAQDAETDPQETTEEEAAEEEAEDETEDEAEDDAAPAPPRFYEDINYNVDEDLDTIWVLDLSNGERIKIRLMEDWAPNHIERIQTLTRQGFYDGIIFHRVMEGFMAQGGDPTGTGRGGSELPDLKNEFNSLPHVRGSVSMARGPDDDSANSQFFIVFYPRFSLDKRYTNFGRVIENMAAVDEINRGEPPRNPTRILQASLASQNKPRPEPGASSEESAISADLLNAPLQQQ